MKILILNLTFYPKVGGVENSLRTLCELYSSRGDAVTVVSADVVDDTGIHYKDGTYMFGAYVRRFKKSNPFTYFLSCYSLIRRLRNEDTFDLVISRSHVTTVLAFYAGFKNVRYIVPGIVKNQYNKKYLTSNSYLSFLKLKFNEYVQKKSFTCADKIFVFSDTMFDQVKAIAPKASIYKTYPGCDESRFYNSECEKRILRRKYGFLQESKILLCVGRLNKVKGFEFAINALADLPDEYILLIVGNGPEYENLISHSKTVGVESRVFIFNSSLEPEIFYRIADVFVFTSTYEPFGQVLLEAAFSNLKIYAFDSDCNSMIDTATKQIFFGFNSFVCYVPDVGCLGNYISNCNDGFVIDAKELEMFKRKYSWRNLVDALDFY